MKPRRLAPRLIGRWPTLPRRTIRLRLTAVYGGLFLACGAALLAINYGLVSGRLTSDYFAKVSVNAGKAQIFIERHGGFSSGGTAVTSPVSDSRAASGQTIVQRSGTAPAGVTSSAIPQGIQLPSRSVRLAIANASSGAALKTLLLESGVALAIMALLAAVLGWVMAGRALRPLRAITATAREISASNLHRRLALIGPDDELRRLGLTFDALLERLETAFTAQRRFAANVSHELRTPLTYERTLVEVALADPNASNERLRAVLGQVLASGEHQECLIDALLVLSRSQRGVEDCETVDLGAVVAEMLERVEARGLEVELSLAPALTEGDPRLVERLASNLLTNAVTYNQPGGRIDVTTRTTDGHAILRVANSGPTIAADDLTRLFEPFQRTDGSRTSTSDGLGLGLSIVQAIADAHAATITTTALEEGGLSIEIAFPGQPRVQPTPPGRHDIDMGSSAVAQMAGNGAGSEPSVGRSS
jgi:signal transduction histidine kinase